MKQVTGAIKRKYSSGASALSTIKDSRTTPAPSTTHNGSHQLIRSFDADNLVRLRRAFNTVNTIDATMIAPVTMVKTLITWKVYAGTEQAPRLGAYVVTRR